MCADQGLSTYVNLYTDLHLQKSDIDFLFDGKGQLYSWKPPGKYTGLIETFGFNHIH